MRRSALMLALITLLSACGAREHDPMDSLQPTRGESFHTENVAISPSIDLTHLKSLSYTIVSSPVRQALTSASLGFTVTFRGGEYRFPAEVVSLGFPRAHLDVSHVVYGDVNGDRVTDAVLPLLIDQRGETLLEIVAVSASGSTAKHFASFPIGKAMLKSLVLTDGKIRVNFLQSIPGDPGPRNTELLLELPRP